MQYPFLVVNTFVWSNCPPLMHDFLYMVADRLLPLPCILTDIFSSDRWAV